MTNSKPNLRLTPPEPLGLLVRLRLWVNLADIKRNMGLFLLLVSTALAEVAANIVYVILLERAYQINEDAASVGGILFVQAAPQVLLGSWAGSLVDRFGQRRAALLATALYASLVVGLIIVHSILVLYILAFLLMLVRLVLTPARLALVSRLSSKENLVAANTSLSAVTGLGLFLGPAFSAAIVLKTPDFRMPLLAAGLGLFLSLVPLSFVPQMAKSASPVNLGNFWEEMRIGWRFIRQHGPVWKVILCLMHFTLVMGVVTPLITPLSHTLGWGSEGTGILFAAIGLGGLLGAPFAIVLVKGLGTSLTLMFTGLIAPVGILLVGLSDNKVVIMLTLLLASLAGSSLTIIVFTVLQRLTPSSLHGRVFGMEQTLVGSIWTISLAATTGGLVFWSDVMNIQLLFFLLGVFGLCLFLVCWFHHWRSITASCKECEPHIQILGGVCQVFCASNNLVSGTACMIICGNRGSSSE